MVFHGLLDLKVKFYKRVLPRLAASESPGGSEKPESDGSL